MVIRSALASVCTGMSDFIMSKIQDGEIDE